MSAIGGSLFALDEEFIGERCFEWFIFDFPVTGEETILELFRQVAAEQLSERERMLLAWWCKTPTAFYEVKALGRQVILVEDILTGDTFCVRGFQNAADMAVGNILYLRLLRVGEEFEFSTAGLSLPGQAKRPLLSWLKKDFNVFRRMTKQRRSGWPLYLRRRAHRIMAWAAAFGSGRDSDPAAGESVWGDRFDNLVLLLEEYLLRELISSRMRREGLKGLLRLLLDEGKGKDALAAEKGDRTAGTEGFPWTRPEYAEVARLISNDLQKRGRGDIIPRALELWHRFCLMEEPVVRKAPAWAAAVVYAVAKTEGRRLSQQRLAAEYGISVSALATNYRHLCRLLGLS
uniref:Uncharacterized protein n=1 Tax=Ammonifex degensii TaxID=42838 RepID=A0A7C1F2N8_9THEO